MKYNLHMINIVAGFGENRNILSARDFANKKKDLEVTIANSDEDLIMAIKDKNVDAVVRGSLKSFNILKTIKLSNNVNKDNKNISSNYKVNRASYIKGKIEDISHEFLIAPVGIDEGNTGTEKKEIAKQCIDFFKKIGKIPKVAILAGGRKEDLGRSSIIDESLKNTEILTKELKKILAINSCYNDVVVKNYYILIEKAIKEGNNIIIAPEGISGNLIFRTMVLLGDWNSYGAITFGIDEIFIDTSRDQSKKGYTRALNFAYKLAKLNKEKQNKIE